MNLEIFPLFSTPIMYIEDTEYQFSQDEIEYFETLKMRENFFNNISKDTYVLENFRMKKIKQFCQNQLNRYTYDILRIKQPFCLTNSWATHNCNGQSHQEHRHYNCIFSGVFYIRSSCEMGSLKFHHGERFSKEFNFQYDFEDHNVFNSGTWTFSTKTATMIIFPSWLRHSVTENQTDSKRIVLGFNAFVEGDFNADYASKLTVKCD